MKKILLTLIVALASLYSLGQINLVYNPSFEDYNRCPYSINQVSFAKYWSSIDTSDYGLTADTVSHPFEASEYCNECSSIFNCTVPNNFSFHHYARTGKGMIQSTMYVDSFVTTEFWNYAQGRLKKTLNSGTQYCVTFYVLHESSSIYYINRIGAYLDDGNIDTTSTPQLPQTNHVPQIEDNDLIVDTVNWTKVQGSFVANGTESFITLGNFYDWAHTNILPTGTAWWNFLGPGGLNYGITLYLIDDVSVIPITAHAYGGHDTSIALHDSVWVGNQDGYLPCYWYKNGVLVDSNVAGFWARPDTSCYYVMALDVCGNITRDTMHITVGHVGLQEPHSPLVGKQNYTLYPNPSDGNITLTQVIPDNAPVTAVLYNALGMVESRTTLQFANGTDHMSIQNAAPGVYLLQLRDASGKEFHLKFVIQ